MSDTIYLSTPGKIQGLPDYSGKTLQGVKHNNATVNASIGGATEMFIFIGIVIFLLLLQLSRILKPSSRIPPKKEIPAGETGLKDIYIYNGQELEINDDDIKKILTKRFPYYISLSPEMKEFFEKRVKKFITLKTFVIPSTEAYKDVPVLLSAAAVQLTFGLREFELPWFQYIRIHSEEYFADDPNALRVLAGHVENNIITVAWNHFLKGIEDDHDGVNVGLHEMAHALYYQQVIVNKSKKNEFIKELSEVMEESEDIYTLKHKHKILYSDNAYKNLQEFWAESIELFFERPEAMKICYPELFENLKELLNQDPLNKSNPVLVI